MKYKELIERVQKIAKKQKIPPEFFPREGGYNNFNCYAYALMLSDIEWQDFEVAPGFMSGIIDTENESYWHKITSRKIIKYVKDDLRKLGRKMIRVSYDTPIEDGTYKIAIFVGDYGFHFVRQNKDGSWSEKSGWLGRVRRTNPKKITYHKLIGVFKISNRAE